MACIIVNTIVMACYHVGQSAEFLEVVEGLNYLFAAVFTIEACIKLLGLGVSRYFASGWNWFDFVLVVGSNVGIIGNLAGAFSA